MSDTGDLFDAVRKESTSRKDSEEPYRIFRLHWARERDLLCFKKLSRYHYRVWTPEHPELTVDFWPRTSVFIHSNNTQQRPIRNKGWGRLMKLLGISRERWRIPDED